MYCPQELDTQSSNDLIPLEEQDNNQEEVKRSWEQIFQGPGGEEIRQQKTLNLWGTLK